MLQVNTPGGEYPRRKEPSFRKLQVEVRNNEIRFNRCPAAEAVESLPSINHIENSLHYPKLISVLLL